MAEIKPAYLIAGSDEAKIAETRRRLRARAEREGGPGALELFEAGEGRRSPDADALIASMATISLTASRRYLLADGVEGWGKGDTEKVAEALKSIPPETTIALVAHGKAPAKLAKAVEAAGGEQLTYEAPRERELPKRLVADAKELGFTLELDAARLLVERLGPRPLRLRNELERLALWAGEGGTRRRRGARGDHRRHLRGGDLDARRRDHRGRRGDRRCASPSGSSPRARRCRGSSTRSRRGCARR